MAGSIRTAVGGTETLLRLAPNAAHNVCCHKTGVQQIYTYEIANDGISDGCICISRLLLCNHVLQHELLVHFTPNLRSAYDVMQIVLPDIPRIECPMTMSDRHCRLPSWLVHKEYKRTPTPPYLLLDFKLKALL